MGAVSKIDIKEADNGIEWTFQMQWTWKPTLRTFCCRQIMIIIVIMVMIIIMYNLKTAKKNIAPTEA